MEDFTEFAFLHCMRLIHGSNTSGKIFLHLEPIMCAHVMIRITRRVSMFIMHNRGFNRGSRMKSTVFCLYFHQLVKSNMKIQWLFLACELRKILSCEKDCEHGNIT